MDKLSSIKQSSLALTIVMCLQSTHAKDYSQVIIFGDSLSDTGRLKYLVSEQDSTLGNTLQPSFTTNPNPIWTSPFAQSHGKTANPNTPDNPPAPIIA